MPPKISSWAFLALFLLAALAEVSPQPPPVVPPWVANAPDHVPNDPSQFDHMRTSDLEASIQKQGAIFFLVKALNLTNGTDVSGRFNSSFWGLGLTALVENGPMNKPIRAAFPSAVSSRTSSNYTFTSAETGNTVHVRQRAVCATYTIRNVPQTLPQMLASPLPSGWTVAGTINVTFSYEVFSEAVNVLYGNETVRVTERDIKFSANTTSWPFSDSRNTLTMFMRTRTADRNGNRTREDVQNVPPPPSDQQQQQQQQPGQRRRAKNERFEFGQQNNNRTASLNLPDYAFLDGVRQSINISAFGPFVMLRFPSFQQSIHYDPVMQVSRPPPPPRQNQDDDDDDGDEDRVVRDGGKAPVDNSGRSSFDRVALGDNETVAYVRNRGQEVFFMVKTLRDDANTTERFDGNFWGLAVAGLVEVSSDGLPVRTAMVLNITGTSGRNYTTVDPSSGSAIRVRERTVSARAAVRQIPTPEQRRADDALKDPRNWTAVGSIDVGFSFNVSSNATLVAYGNRTVPVSQRDVKFSATLSAWPFSNPANSLHLILRARSSGRDGREKNETVERDQEKERRESQQQGGGRPLAQVKGFRFGQDSRNRSAEMAFPDYALVDGAEANITVDYREDSVVLAFPSYSGSIYYDPKMSIQSQGSAEAPAAPGPGPGPSGPGGAPAQGPSDAQRDAATRLLEAGSAEVEMKPENFDRLQSANAMAYISKKDAIFFMIKPLADGGANLTSGNINATFWALRLLGLVEFRADGSPARAAMGIRNVSTAGSNYTFADGPALVTVRERRILASIPVRNVPANPLGADPASWTLAGAANISFVSQVYSNRTYVEYGNSSVLVTERDIKFSANVTNWPFADPANTLGLFLKVKISDAKGNSTEEAVEPNEDEEEEEDEGGDDGNGGRGSRLGIKPKAAKKAFKFGPMLGGDGKQRGAKMDFPEVALVDGVQKNIAVSSRGPWVMLSFPAHSRYLYYYPTMAVEEPPVEAAGEGSAASASSVASIFGLFLALLLALLSHTGM